MPIGGIDVDAACGAQEGVRDSSIWQIFTGVNVQTFAYVNGRGAGEASRWECFLLATRYGLSDEAANTFGEDMESYEGGESPMPVVSNYEGIDLDSDSTPLDMDRACKTQYSANSWAVLGNANDWTSWKCYGWAIPDPSNIA